MRAERLDSPDDRTDYDEPPRRRRWGRLLLLFVLAVFLVSGGAWGWLIHGKRVTAMFASSGGDGIPVVRADPAPFKTRPSDPGGMEVPDRDKLVYQRLQGDSSETRVERLLPQPEKPVPPSRASSSSPAPQVAERLPRVPTEAQVRAAQPPPPPRIAGAPTQERVPEPEDSPPTAEETAPASVSEQNKGDGREPSVLRGQESRGPERPSEPGTASPAGVREQNNESTPVTPTPTSTPAPVASAPPASVREQNKESTAAPASGYLIQIAAVREPERAEAEWARLQRQHAELLRGLKLFVIKADLGDKGVFWRLRAGPFTDEVQAKNRCADLAKQKVGCLVVKAQG